MLRRESSIIILIQIYNIDKGISGANYSLKMPFANS